MDLRSQTNRAGYYRTAILIAIAAGILTLVPAYIWGIPGGADLTNHFRFAMPLYDEIAAGNPIPGWLAESNYGFGDPRFRFYPPFIYYLLCAARYLTGDWYIATLVVFTLFSVVGTLGMYLWSRRHLDPATSILATLIFAFVPYHLTQFYQASLLAEFAAMSLLPLAFLFVDRIGCGIPRNSYGSIAGLAISFALIVMTHLPTTVIGSLSLGAYALLVTDWRSNKRALLKSAAAIMLGLLISSWFWIKMVCELPWIQAGQGVTSAYYDYRNNFLFSPWAVPNLNVYYGSLVAAITAGIALPVVFVVRSIFGRREPDSTIEGSISGDPVLTRRMLRAAAILSVGSLLMTTDLSRPIWWVVPKLKDIQFPYRWLTLASIMLCPLAALGYRIFADRMRQWGFKPRHLPIVVIVLLSVAIGLRDLVIDSEYLDRGTFLEKIEAARGGQSFSDWLPVGSAELKDVERMEGPIDPVGRTVISGSWGTHERRFTLTEGTETTVRLRSYYYPLWQATSSTADGIRPLATSQARDGTLLVTIPPESSEIDLVFTEPPRTKWTLIVSAVALTGAVVLMIIGIAGNIRRRRL